MNFAEFHQAVAEIAGDELFSVSVEAETPSKGTYATRPRTTKVNWQAYINGRGFTREYGTPEEVLAELNGTRVAETTLADVGEAPQSSERVAAELVQLEQREA